jgi:ubiquinone/menaquinone biosynthesis C-methylase UbiE
VSGHQHPLFARVYEKLSPGAEKHGQAENRQRMLAGLRGRVVEVGAGNGLNFAHYPATVTEVVAVEPESYLRKRATERAAEAPVKVTVVDGTADTLPVEDDSVDAVVTSLVLCSVPDQASALAEAQRVIKPGGELRFYEHVISHRPVKAGIQRAFTATIWKRISGGCHMDRDTGRAIADAGFDVEELDRISFQGLSHILGVARAPGGYPEAMETEEDQQGYPEGNPEGPGDQRGGDESDTSGAPDTSSPEEGDAGQATGNPDAAG